MSDSVPHDGALAARAGFGPVGARDDVSQFLQEEGTSLRGEAVVSDHELLKQIGVGSYGEVWLARSAVGTLRAVKIVYRKTFWHEYPFEREFKGIQKFEPLSRSHEGLVDILQIGRGEGYFYYVMELADGAKRSNRSSECRGNERPLTVQESNPAPLQHPISYMPRTLQSELAHRSRLPVSECLQIGLSLTSALGHLHQNGLVHRDVKPGNVIFVGGVPKLADIGLVAAVAEARSYVGTEGFIPPEGPGSPQADLYSLGKLLYEISTGKDRHAFPELPSDLAEQSEAQQMVELNAILLKACQNEVRERYQCAAAMHAELELLRRGESVKRKRTLQQRWAVCKKVSLAVVLLASAVVAALLLIALGSRFWQRRVNQDAENHNRSNREPNPSIELGRLDQGEISTNSEANVLYHRAMGIMRSDDYKKLGEAYTNFTEATRLDPNFARPYAALFEMHVREDFIGMPQGQQEDQLRKLRAKLEELDPSLSGSATHVARACVQYMDWQFDKAKKSWEKAILLNPNNEFAHTSYGFALTRWGDSSNALKELSIAAVLEPAKGQIQRALGDPYYLKREYTNAFYHYHEGLRYTPDSSAGHRRIGRVYRAMHQYLEAIDEFEKAELIGTDDEANTKESFNQLRAAFKNNGEKGYWQEQLNRTEKEPDSEFYWKAAIHVYLGHTNDVFRCLNKSLESREQEADGLHHELNNLLFDEYWDPLREDPRFKELVRKISFPGN